MKYLTVVQPVTNILYYKSSFWTILRFDLSVCQISTCCSLFQGVIYSLLSYCVYGKWSNIYLFIAFKHLSFQFCFQLCCLQTFQTTTPLSNIQSYSFNLSTVLRFHKVTSAASDFSSVPFLLFLLLYCHNGCASLTTCWNVPPRFISIIVYMNGLYRQICTSTMMPMNVCLCELL